MRIQGLVAPKRNMLHEKQRPKIGMHQHISIPDRKVAMYQRLKGGQRLTQAYAGIGATACVTAHCRGAHALSVKCILQVGPKAQRLRHGCVGRLVAATRARLRNLPGAPAESQHRVS
jgi:hypothetical protein